MHPSQKDGNKYAGYVPLADLGKPIGAPRTVPTVSGWTKQVDENAVVAGLLRIDQRGTYQFRTSSGYDRNELLLDGKVVCKFRDGENKVATVELRIGLLPIVSVGYAGTQQLKSESNGSRRVPLTLAIFLPTFFHTDRMNRLTDDAANRAPLDARPAYGLLKRISRQQDSARTIPAGLRHF
jgi:hypothetical protein